MTHRCLTVVCAVGRGRDADAGSGGCAIPRRRRPKRHGGGRTSEGPGNTRRALGWSVPSGTVTKRS